MERIPHGKYTKEFREEAVKFITEEKLSIPETARRLNLPKSTLESWIRKYRAGKLGEVGQNYRSLTETEMELARY
jgi:transposase-like protein